MKTAAAIATTMLLCAGCGQGDAAHSATAVTTNRNIASSQSQASARRTSDDAAPKASSSPGYIQAMANQDGTGSDNRTHRRVGL